MPLLKTPAAMIATPRSTQTGQQFLQRDLVEQRVAAREQEAVEVRLARKPRQHLRLVHARPDGADDTVGAQLVERAIGAVQRVLEMVVGVVDVEDVQAFDAEPSPGSPRRSA